MRLYCDSVLWHSEFSMLTSVGLHKSCRSVAVMSLKSDSNLSSIVSFIGTTIMLRHESKIKSLAFWFCCIVIVMCEFALTLFFLINLSKFFCMFFSGKFEDCSSLPQFYSLVTSFMVYIMSIGDTFLILAFFSFILNIFLI